MYVWMVLALVCTCGGEKNCDVCVDGTSTSMYNVERQKTVMGV